MKAMKVILLENVASVGSLGDVVRVRPGYARNYLFPQGKAEYASAEAIEQFSARRSELESRQEEQKEIIQKAHAILDGYTLTVEVRAVADGNLYGSITPHIIATEINQQGILGNVSIKRGQVHLPNGAIKTVDNHPAEVKFAAGLVAHLTISVLAQAVDKVAEVSDGSDSSNTESSSQSSSTQT